MARDVDVRVEGRVATVSWSRPARRNAMDTSLAEALRRIFEDLASEDSCAVVALRPEGPAFCAGWDVSELGAVAGASPEEIRAFLSRNLRLLEALEALPAVTVACVRGAAVGFGSALAARCDLAIAGADATFGFPEVGVGFPPLIAMLDARMVMPDREAMAWLVDGRPRNGHEAREAGLVTACVPSDALDRETDRQIGAIAAHHPRVVQASKRLFRRIAGADAGEAERLALEAAGDNLRTDEAREGIRAFLAGQRPSWHPDAEGDDQ